MLASAPFWEIRDGFVFLPVRACPVSVREALLEPLAPFFVPVFAMGLRDDSNHRVVKLDGDPQALM